jgi:hypothetical protein
MNWMLFIGPGVAPEHFFFNGEYPPINVTPGPEHKTIWSTDIPDEPGEPAILEILLEVLANSRKKTFTIHKQKYTVIARGKLVSYE